MPYLVFHRPGVDVDVEVNPSRVQKKCGLPPSQGLDDLAKHDLDAWVVVSIGTPQFFGMSHNHKHLQHCGVFTLKFNISLQNKPSAK